MVTAPAAVGTATGTGFMIVNTAPFETPPGVTTVTVNTCAVACAGAAKRSVVSLTNVVATAWPFN